MRSSREASSETLSSNAYSVEAVRAWGLSSRLRGRRYSPQKHSHTKEDALVATKSPVFLLWSCCLSLRCLCTTHYGSAGNGLHQIVAPAGTLPMSTLSVPPSLSMTTALSWTVSSPTSTLSVLSASAAGASVAAFL